MKIIFVNRFFHPDHSATSRLLSDLAFSLASADEDVHVVTSRQRYDDPAACLAPEETVRGVSVHRVTSTRFGRERLAGCAMDFLTFFPTAASALNRWVAAGDVLVAKTDPPMLSTLASRIARRKGAVLVNWLQDIYPEVAEALDVRGTGALGSMLRSLRNESLNRAFMNVVPGEGMALRISDEGVAPDRIRVVHNWADGAQIVPVGPAENPLRAHWGLADKFVVGYSGNMGRVHEFETLLGAAAELADRPDIRIVLIGDGPRRASIQHAVASGGLRNVVFHAYQPRDRLAQTLSVPDVHLVSLRPEMEGLVVPSKFYGIAAAGRPMLFVGDPDGELARRVSASGCGLAVRAGDASGLARIILDLKQHTDLRLQMGRRARQLLEQRFERRLATARWSQLLGEARSMGPGQK